MRNSRTKSRTAFYSLARCHLRHASSARFSSVDSFRSDFLRNTSEAVTIGTRAGEGGEGGSAASLASEKSDVNFWGKTLTIRAKTCCSCDFQKL